MKNVTAIVVLMSTPISWAASRSCEVDRMARPRSVRVTKTWSATIRKMASRTMKTLRNFTDAPSTLNDADVEDLGHVHRRRAPDDLDHVLQDERDADRRDQGSQPRSVTQRPVRESLDHDSHHAHHDHADREGEEQDAGELERVADGPVEAQRHQEPERHERADHEDVAVREIDQLDDAVDHRVAQRDEGIDRADGQRVHQLLDEGRDIHALLPWPFGRGGRGSGREADAPPPGQIDRSD